MDGVYSADPKKVADAIRYEQLTFQDVLPRDLRVMDTSAVALARDNAIPIIVFSMHEPGRLRLSRLRHRHIHHRSLRTRRR